MRGEGGRGRRAEEGGREGVRARGEGGRGRRKGRVSEEGESGEGRIKGGGRVRE